jgi:hypothetical protein
MWLLQLSLIDRRWDQMRHASVILKIHPLMHIKKQHLYNSGPTPLPLKALHGARVLPPGSAPMPNAPLQENKPLGLIEYR